MTECTESAKVSCISGRSTRRIFAGGDFCSAIGHPILVCGGVCTRRQVGRHRTRSRAERKKRRRERKGKSVARVTGGGRRKASVVVSGLYGLAVAFFERRALVERDAILVAVDLDLRDRRLHPGRKDDGATAARIENMEVA